MSALPDVLESARGVVRSAAFVSIDEQVVHRWAEAQSATAFATPSLPEELQFSGSRDDSANLILLLDCLNFCFWSDKPWSVDFRGRPWSRTYAMYASVLRAVEQDAGWLKPGCWASVDLDDVARLFRGRGQIPMLEQRRQVLNETGRCLIESFGGRFANAVERAGQHARRCGRDCRLAAPPGGRTVGANHDSPGKDRA